MRPLDHRRLVAALHELEDLARHGALDDLEQPGDVELERAVLGAAEVERADAALVVGGDGECSPAGGRSPARRTLRPRAARASARRSLPSRRAPSSCPARRRPPSTACHGADAIARAWSVEISCVGTPDTGAGRRSGKRAAIVTCDPAREPALAHALRDLLGEPLGAHARGADDDLADDIADVVLEARARAVAESGSTVHSIRAENGCAER